jgi:hypothetical protein
MSYPALKRQASANPRQRFMLLDPDTGAPLTVAYNTSGLSVVVVRDDAASPSVYTSTDLADITTLGTYAAPDSGEVRFASVGHGLHEVQLEQASTAASTTAHAVQVIIILDGVVLAAKELGLVAVDLQDSADMGLSDVAEITKIPRSDTDLAAGAASRHERIGGGTGIDDVEIKAVP